ncbi:surface protease GP63 [Trypanosoma grayi]|uniref:surface protease GP63 n=1 Tax=Trypanosoma grayi TaxID=71804 RepID=UPI0004F47718|nr:surface protease GP63 [Trypanosoma grayi]KEG06775.1 surface protease GP63 [Trypanosoma grayi]
MLRCSSLHAVALLPLLLCACGCFAVGADRGVFDTIGSGGSDQHRVSVVRTVPMKGESGHQAYILSTGSAESDAGWGALRIHVSHEDLDLNVTNTSTRICLEGRTRTRGFSVYNVPYLCPDQTIVTAEKRRVLLEVILPKAIKLHSERLTVKNVEGKLKLDAFDDPICKMFTVPKDHFSEGVTNADFVLYVAAAPGPVVARTCSVDKTGATGLARRPTAGALNFDPERIVDTRYSVRIAAHEIAHALGFNRGVIKAAELTSTCKESVNGPTKTGCYLTAPTTMNAIKEHYNCSTEPPTNRTLLEADGDDERNLHWPRRIAKDELMSPYVGATGGAFYTALTMSVFHDLGYYRARFDMAEKMRWGNQSGCGFLNEKCVNKSQSKFGDMFCTESEESGKLLRCTSDRFALGTCSLTTHTTHIPSQFMYFADRSRGGPKAQRMDYCPIITPTAGTVCESGEVERMPGSFVGPMSRCLSGESIVLNTTDGAGTQKIGGLCAKVTCKSRGVVKIRFNGSDVSYICDPKHGNPKIDLKELPAFKSGYVFCPTYEEVCSGAEIEEDRPSLTPEYEYYTEPSESEEKREKNPKGRWTLDIEKWAGRLTRGRGHGEAHSGSAPVKSATRAIGGSHTAADIETITRSGTASPNTPQKMSVNSRNITLPDGSVNPSWVRVPLLLLMAVVPAYIGAF